jgi:hypothetical protein
LSCKKCALFNIPSDKCVKTLPEEAERHSRREQIRSFSNLRDRDRVIFHDLTSNKFLNIPGMRRVGQLFLYLSKRKDSYGPTFKHGVLQHTMIWFSSAVGCSNQPDKQRDYHRYLALHCLVRDWNEPAALKEGHLFAVWLMAIVAARDLSQGSYSKCLSAFFFILRDISQRSCFYKRFWPMLRDELIFVSFRYFIFFDCFSFRLHCYENACGLLGPTSTAERDEYERELGRSIYSSTVSDDFFFPTLLLYSISLRQLFQEIVESERSDSFLRHPGVHLTLDKVKSGLQAKDVAKAWGEIIEAGWALENLRTDMESFSTPIEEQRRNVAEMWLALDMSAMSVMLSEFCGLLIWILEEPSILRAFRTPRVMNRATAILSRLQCITEMEVGDHSGKRWTIFAHLKQRSLFTWLVWIAGLACPDEDCISFCVRANFISVGLGD